ncbi:MAG: PEP/pyruvate-binding domain-containing protein [Sphaerochaeta sp.]
MYTLDPTWLPFTNLMLNHIYNVLLICNDYDRFLLEEDGRVEEELYIEYTQLRLSNPPKITHASSGEEAIELLKSRQFELVITMLDLGPESVEDLASSIKAVEPAMPIIALSPSSSHRRNKLIKGSDSIAIDYFFYWQGDPTIFLAMIKLVEDQMNLEHDIAEADVGLIILVEDSVRFYSSYLPMIYTCLIQQTQAMILEALNTWGKTLRMRGRPKIVLAKNYEEAIALYEKYQRHILGVITDISYELGGTHNKYAGFALAKELHRRNSELPILLQSNDLSMRERAEVMGVHFIYKRSHALFTQLAAYMRNNYGFGPFTFRDPATGAELARVETMRELQHILPEIDLASFEYHFRHEHFSRWLRAQSLYTIASKIKALKIPDGGDVEQIRKEMIETIRTYRSERTKGVIAQFSPANYDETLFFSRIGTGSLGGKGRGLAFIDMVLRQAGVPAKYPDIYLSIPRTVIIATDQFEQFLADNELQDISTADLPDETLLSIFLSKDFSEELVENLKHILTVITQPMCIRSSSLLEDSHYQPFAGVYETVMIPNRGSSEERLNELSAAIKSVWASTYFRKAKEYLKATDYLLGDEKMAIIIQQVIGSEHGSYWYPNIGGVARSINYYPPAGEKPEDGVGLLSFGFGKAVVESGSALRFSPTHPKRPAQFLGGNQSSSQESFYALDLRNGFHPSLGALDNLTLIDLKEADAKSLQYVASTFDLANGTFNEAINAVGKKIITFNGVLKYDAFPLAAAVRDVLRVGSEAMGRPVEIEFAVNLNRKAPKRPEFSLLQIRPIALGSEESDVMITDDDRTRSLIHSTTVLGNGTIDEIEDIIYLKLESFDQSKMVEMAQELDELNMKMVLAEKDYILLVAGRLGSSDPWLGIPVSWSQISRSKVIVETGLKDLRAEPSQGTHFFQNLTSLGCFYVTINPDFAQGSLNTELLATLAVIEETTHFVHARGPLTVKVNGFIGEGVILKG